MGGGWYKRDSSASHKTTVGLGRGKRVDFDTQ